MGGKSSKGAYRQMESATAEANRLQKEQFDKSVELQKPWLDAGQRGLEALLPRLGIGGSGDLLQAYNGQNLFSDPSYNFRFNEGQKATERQQAAAGRFLTPAATKALQRYGQDMASQEYSNAYNRFNNDQMNVYNRLAGLSGVGQQQAGNISQLGQNYADTISNNNMQQANAYANMKAANAAGRSSLFGNVMQLGGSLGGSYLMGRPF